MLSRDFVRRLKASGFDERAYTEFRKAEAGEGDRVRFCASAKYKRAIADLFLRNRSSTPRSLSSSPYSLATSASPKPSVASRLQRSALSLKEPILMTTRSTMSLLAMC